MKKPLHLASYLYSVRSILAAEGVVFMFFLHRDLKI